MLVKRSGQLNLFSVESRLRKKVREGSYYVFLADHRHELFSDEDFAMLYCADDGRNSVPPSLLATALILQTFDRASDQEATDRAQFDQRWQVALGFGDEEVPFAKSTLCVFRNQLIIHKKAKFIFQKGIDHLRRHGFVKKHKIRLALDTTAIFGKGAVEDTFNLLAEGLRQVLKALAEIIDGVAQDRIVSVHDPEMRHGHKSATQRFDDYKASVAVETDSQVVADVDVLPANAHDSTNASSLVAESAKNLETPVEGIVGDGAYGSVEARLDARTDGYEITAPVGRLSQTRRFIKDDFKIDLDKSTVTCPAGQTTTTSYANTTKLYEELSSPIGASGSRRSSVVGAPYEHIVRNRRHINGPSWCTNTKHYCKRQKYFKEQMSIERITVSALLLNTALHGSVVLVFTKLDTSGRAKSYFNWRWQQQWQT